MMLSQFKKLLALCGYPQRGIGPRIIAQSGVPSSVTGTTSTTTLATIPIPAGALGPNGVLRVTSLWNVTANTNTKTVRGQFGGVSAFAIAFGSSYGALQHEMILRNQNTLGSQICFGSPSSSFGLSTLGALQLSIDSSQTQNLTLGATLGVSTDTVTLEGYTVEVLNP